ncbi:Eukaryotic translation initiation factor 4 gamma, partial [Leucoagaricus sp. SymC.cos]
LQFMAICKEKPEGLSLIDAISLKPVGPTSPAMRRSGSGRHHQTFGPSDPSRLVWGLGINATSGFGESSGLTFTGEEMANFQKAPKLTNKEQFQLSTSRSASVGEPTSILSGQPVTVKGTPNWSGPGGLWSNRTRSQRSKQRDGVKMVALQIAIAQVAAPANLKPVAPLGLIKFIGELFKLQMLTEHNMHECVKKLLVNVNDPEEEEIENLCKLLMTVGDVIELRDRRWTMKIPVASESTEITQVHEAVRCSGRTAPKSTSEERLAEMNEDAAEKIKDLEVSMLRTAESGADRSLEVQSQWRKLAFLPRTKPTEVETYQSQESSMTEEASASVLAVISTQEAAEVNEGIARMSQEAAQKKIKEELKQFFAVRNPDEAEFYFTAVLTVHNSLRGNESDSNTGEIQPILQKNMIQLRERISGKPLAAEWIVQEGVKKYLVTRNSVEAKSYFEMVPTQCHGKLVESLVSSAIISKENDILLVKDFFSLLVKNESCSQEAFEEGLGSSVKLIDDLSEDIHKAYQLLAIMVDGAELDKERRERMASRSKDKQVLLFFLSTREEQYRRLQATILDLADLGESRLSKPLISDEVQCMIDFLYLVCHQASTN